MNGDDRTPYEKWMEQYENKKIILHSKPTLNSTHGYSTNPLHTPKYPPTPPPPPPPSSIKKRCSAVLASWSKSFAYGLRIHESVQAKGRHMVLPFTVTYDLYESNDSVGFPAPTLLHD